MTLVDAAIVASALPVIEVIGATAASVGADAIAHGSFAGGLLLNSHS